MTNDKRRSHKTSRGQAEYRQPQELRIHQRYLEYESQHAEAPDSGNRSSAQVDPRLLARGRPEDGLHETSVGDAQRSRPPTRFWSDEKRSQDLTPQPQVRTSGSELLDDVANKRLVVHVQGALIEPGWTELLTNRFPERFVLIGRLRPDVTVGEAAAQLAVLAAALAAEHPDASRHSQPYVVAERHARPEPNASRHARPLMSVVMGLASLVLLVAIANVGTLLVGRGAARRQELALRAGLGATRWRLVRQLVTESALLALMGGAGGGIVALWAADLVLATFAAATGTGQLNVGPFVDWRVFGFTAAVAIGAGLLTGLAPALRSTRFGLSSAIGAGGRRRPPAGGRGSARLFRTVPARGEGRPGRDAARGLLGTLGQDTQRLQITDGVVAG